MTAFFRPRRGKKATAESQNIVLKRGEVFFEYPDSGVGTGTGRIKVGNGVTSYASLPYFMNLDNFISDISTATVTFTETSETSNSTLLGRIITGAGLNTIVASVKNLLYNIDNSITTMQQNFQAGVDDIYDAVVAKGSTPASHSLSDVVAGIMAIQTSPPTQTKSCTPSTSAQTITPDDGYLLSSVSVSAISTQTKTCTPSTSAQTISPDSGKYLSSVSVSAIPNLHTSNSMIVPRWGTGAGSKVPATQVVTRNPRVSFDNNTTYGSAEMIEIAMPEGYYAWSYGNSSCCIPTETKSVTAGTSNKTVTPTEYNTGGKYVKFLKSVTVAPTPTQAKTITASRSAQTVTPDSGKYLSKVTVNKYPDASGTYTYGSGSTGGTVDLGATNNLRYVNASNVYAKGKADGAAAPHSKTYYLHNDANGKWCGVGTTNKMNSCFVTLNHGTTTYTSFTVSI